MTQIEIGVRLLNEGTDAWVMVPARNVRANVRQILDTDGEARWDCELEFKPGDLVTLRDYMNAAGEEFPIAMHLPGSILL